MQSRSSADEEARSDGKKNRGPVPLAGVHERVGGRLEDPVLGRRDAERGRELRGDDQDCRGREEAEEHRPRHEVCDDTRAEQADREACDPDDERQQDSQGDVLVAARWRLSRQRAEREQGGQGDRPRLEVRGRGEQGGRDRGKRGRVQATVRGHAGELGIGERLRNEHRCHRQAGDQVADRDGRTAGRDHPAIIAAHAVGLRSPPASPHCYGQPVMTRTFPFTSESVTEGHPDKIADQISDAILDAILAGDPAGRVACETLVTTGLVVVAGELTTSTYVDIPRLVREKIREIGYDRAKYGFDCDTCGIILSIDGQSPDIAQGVNEAYEIRHAPGDDDPLDLVGAGDQGMMFGYACTETDELMPVPIMIAHSICHRLAEVRKADVVGYLRPDGKAQVTVRYEVGADGRQRPIEIERIVVSTQHADGLDVESMVKLDVIEHVLRPVLPRHLYDESRLEEKGFVLVNPTGRFVAGGPISDTGVTGRKIIVDTYGGMARHGGGAFSGKDPTKVDRSAAYAARYVAKNVVAAGLADRCELQVAYAIGVAQPVSIEIECFDTESVPVSQIEALVREHFDLRPAAIIRDLDLRRPIYAKTARYGHFGRDDRDFTWERTDKAEALREAAGLDLETLVQSPALD